MDRIFILDECCSNPGTEHTQDWVCPACAAEHIAGFFMALSTWGMAEKIRRVKANGALLRQGRAS